jgi:hypothetical protein
VKEILQFFSTLKCRILQLRNFAPHNSDLGPTDGINSYFVDYQFIWIYETYSVVHDWDGKAKQDVCADPIKKKRFGFPLWNVWEESRQTVRVDPCARPAFGLSQKHYVLNRYTDALIAACRCDAACCEISLTNITRRLQKTSTCNQHRICLSLLSCYSDRSYIHHCCTYDYNMS